MKYLRLRKRSKLKVLLSSKFNYVNVNNIHYINTNVKNVYRTEKPVPPLKNLQFYIHGFGPKTKDKLKIKILKLGGNVPSKITATLAAVVSTHEEVGKLSKKISEAQDNDIQVVEDTFFELIKPDGAVSETLKLIDEHNIAPWGSTVCSHYICNCLIWKLPMN